MVLNTDNSPDAAAIAADALSRINAIKPTTTSIEKPSYIYTVENQKTGEVSNRLDYVKYSNFLRSHFSVIYFNKTLYIYDSFSHVYRQQTNEIETHIRDTIVSFGIYGKLKAHIDEIKTHLVSMGSYTEYPFNCDAYCIPVENGIIKLDYENEAITLLPHGPSHFFTYKLVATYDPNAKNCNAIPLLKRLVEPEYIKTLIQIPAQALLQMQTGHAYKKAYLLQGEPHAGKTSYLKLLYMLFGNDFTTSISLQQLCTDRFVGGNLEGKLLNIYDDLEDVALEVIDQFKTLTGDCRHGIERKYSEKYTGKVTAVHIFTCNYPPEYPAKVRRDTAFWARWEYLKFPFAYPVNPNFYTEWYTKETISSFLNLILSAMIVIRKRGLLANSDIQDVMENWSINSDPMYDFLGSLFVSANGKDTHYFSKSKLYNVYVRWCNDNNIPDHRRKLTLTAFSIALQGHGFTPSRKRENRNNYEVYSSITMMLPQGSPLDLDYKTECTKIS